MASVAAREFAAVALMHLPAGRQFIVVSPKASSERQSKSAQAFTFQKSQERAAILPT
jgi:hypothetical protein